MKIVKTLYPTHWGYGLHIDSQYIQPHLYIDAQPELLEVKLYTPATEVVPERVLLWQKIELDSLKSLNGFVDQTLWTTLDSVDFIEVDGQQSPITIHPGQIVDILSKTLSSKSMKNSAESGYSRTPFVIYVGDSSGDFDDFTMILRLDNLEEFVFEGPSASSITNEIVQYAKDLIPPITLSSTQTSVGVDSSITVNVSTDPSVKEIYLEQVYGILNKMRVPLTNGSGTFNILTTGLEVGDMIRVKAGYKKYTGIADFNITVS